MLSASHSAIGESARTQSVARWAMRGLKFFVAARHSPSRKGKGAQLLSILSAAHVLGCPIASSLAGQLAAAGLGFANGVGAE